ncbi:MAG: hypothetical protein ACI9UT_002577 [Flavobacteriales bacterium]|jgi:hypothetical protein
MTDKQHRSSLYASIIEALTILDLPYGLTAVVWVYSGLLIDDKNIEQARQSDQIFCPPLVY